MKRIDFWFDPISPFACLAFERLPQALEGCSYAVEYRPLLFAGLLAQWGQKGPAEIEPKRAWTFRHVAWLAHQFGVPIEVPAQHPFNPLALLRLCVAAGSNRRRVSTMSPTNSTRTGSVSAAGKTSTIPPRIAKAPCSSTGSSRVNPPSTSKSASC